jgi:hypothetical protein
MEIQPLYAQSSTTSQASLLNVAIPHEQGHYGGSKQASSSTWTFEMDRSPTLPAYDSENGECVDEKEVDRRESQSRPPVQGDEDGGKEGTGTRSHILRRIPFLHLPALLEKEKDRNKSDTWLKEDQEASEWLSLFYGKLMGIPRTGAYSLKFAPMHEYLVRYD